MAHSDDSNVLHAESHLKRKAISECRLQDPKIWTKISWIRTNFVKDLESGVRKRDFYNYVTEHLGKTGYRDVWHLLKIAYPHVDRVRRGRKYMYWGVRHADEHAKFDETNDENNGEDEDEETNIEQDNEFIAEESALTMDDVGSQEENSAKTMVDSSYSLALPNSKASLSADTMPGIPIKVEKDPDIDEQEEEEVVIMEFKDKDVFASFEDYEKSKQSADQNGNLIETKVKKIRRNNSKKDARNNITRSVSPPLEIFAFESFKDDEKNKLLDSIPKDHHDDGQHGNHEEQVSSLKQEGCYGDGDHGAATLKDQENKSGAKREEGKLSLGERKREEFAPSLLHPENINRMCMPLMKDLGNQANKTRASNEINDQLNSIQDNNMTSVSTVDTDPNDNEMGLNGKFPYHPLIISVASIAGVEESKGSDKGSSNEINDILKASQLQSCKSVTARVDVNHGSTRQSPPPHEQSSPDNNDGAEFVVVQDRGIQVTTEKIHTCNSFGKGTHKQVKPVRQKPSHSPHDNTLKKLPCSSAGISLRSRTVYSKNSIPTTEGGLQNVPSSERTFLLKPMSSTGLLNRSSPRQPESNSVPCQPRLPMAVPRDSHSVTKAMGNIVRSEEPLMKALVNKPPSYHAFVANKSSPDRVNFAGPHLQSEPKTLLPKRVISPEVVNTVNKPHRDGLSPKYSSSQNVVYCTSMEQRPSLTLPHGQQGKRLLDESLNKTLVTDQLSSHNERDNRQGSPQESPLTTRDFLRNLLSPDSNPSLSTTTSTSDLQVTVECLSKELEKERTLRLRLEIELRKVENQLNEERKLNEQLAALLMKR